MDRRDWIRWIAAALWLVLPCAHAADATFLDPAEAFQFSVRPAGAGALDVHYRIAKGYYLYKERFHFRAEPDTVKLGEPIFPKAETKFDETFNKTVELYRDEVTVRIPVQADGTVTIVSTAQGCADAGLCYPPQEAKGTLQLVGAAANDEPSDAGGSAAAPAGFSNVEAALRSGNLLWIAALFVGGGLILAFTPCVLPMVPILSSIIAGSMGEHDYAAAGARRAMLLRMRALFLSLAYSLGMALVYTGMGVAAGLAGRGLAATLQMPAVLWTFALILVGLSMSMFGFYQLQMPSGMQSRLTKWCGRAEGGRMVGVFIMGALSALIVGPCVAAPLAATLLYISQTGNGWIGGTALFSMAVGMSIPLMVVGVSEGALLPKAGPWMESVKRFFGVLLIAVAIWMVTPVIAASVQMLAWGALLVVASVYLRVFDSLAPTANGWARLWKGVGVLLLLGGAAEIAGVAMGGRDVLQPLGELASRKPDGQPAAAAPTQFTRIRSTQDLNARLSESNKPVMLVFSADWCVACKEMERFTFKDQRVASRMSNFVVLEADVTRNSADDLALLKRFNLFGPPVVLFFDASGRPVPAATATGYQSADQFLASLERALG